MTTDSYFFHAGRVDVLSNGRHKVDAFNIHFQSK